MKTIVHVEDSLLMQSRVAQWIQTLHRGAAILSTDTLANAEELIANHAPDFLILDLYLPDGNALERIAFFKWMAPGMQIAVFSNECSDFMRHICFERGADWVFDKSTDITKLIEVICPAQETY